MGYLDPKVSKKEQEFTSELRTAAVTEQDNLAYKLDEVLGDPTAYHLKEYALQMQNELSERYASQLETIQNMLKSIDFNSLTNHSLHYADYRSEQRDMINNALKTVGSLLEDTQQSYDTMNLIPYTTAATITTNDEASANRVEESKSNNWYRTAGSVVNSAWEYLLKFFTRR